MAFTMSLFAAVTIQKNTRDEAQIRTLTTPSISDNTKNSAKIAHQTSHESDASKSLFGTVKSKIDGGE